MVKYHLSSLHISLNDILCGTNNKCNLYLETPAFLPLLMASSAATVEASAQKSAFEMPYLLIFGECHASVKVYLNLCNAYVNVNTFNLLKNILFFQF